MGLKKFIAKGMNNFFGQALFVVMTSTSIGYFSSNDLDKVNDDISPYRADALKNIEGVFASIDASKKAISEIDGKRELGKINAITLDSSDVAKANFMTNEAEKDLYKKLTKETTGLAKYMLSSSVVNEVDFRDLTERFNVEGLSNYSSINLVGADRGYEHRDECLSSGKEDVSSTDQDVLGCMAEYKRESKAEMMTVTMAAVFMMFIFGVPETIAGTKTLKKWRKEKKPQQRPDN